MINSDFIKILFSFFNLKTWDDLRNEAYQSAINFFDDEVEPSAQNLFIITEILKQVEPALFSVNNRPVKSENYKIVQKNNSSKRPHPYNNANKKTSSPVHKNASPNKIIESVEISDSEDEFQESLKQKSIFGIPNNSDSDSDAESEKNITPKILISIGTQTEPPFSTPKCEKCTKKSYGNFIDYYFYI